MKTFKRIIVMISSFGILLTTTIQPVSARGFKGYYGSRHYSYGHHRRHFSHRHSRRHFFHHPHRRPYVYRNHRHYNYPAYGIGHPFHRHYGKRHYYR